jgi:hypothetical protein
MAERRVHRGNPLRRALALAAFVGGLAATFTSVARERQSLDDAWFTGPIITAGASTLPKGRMLIEPYIYDVVTRGRYDENGDYRATDTQHSYGSLTYLLYGVADNFTIGAIPTFGYNNPSMGEESSGVGVGDISLQAQYRLLQFRENGRAPTLSFVVQETLPTGKHDRLGTRLSDGLGSGAYSTTLGLYSQYYFWMPSGRVLRARLNGSYTIPRNADVTGTSVYGTPASFSGRALPGNSLAIHNSWEYSITREWVFALDVVYQHDDNTHVTGVDTATSLPFEANSGSSWRFALVPALEYNWTSRVGIIVGARWFTAGRNTSASVTPVAAINIVY